MSTQRKRDGGAAAPRVLFACAELHPLIKTGGLADVAAALPAALAKSGVAMTILLPAYRAVRESAGPLVAAGAIEVGGQRLALLAGRHPGSGVPLWLLDAPGLYDRDGDPYHDGEGRPFPDNALRFGLFCEAIAALVLGDVGGGFDLVHLNDWQTGLAAAHLARAGRRVPSVFTIHNLAYQGMFGREAFDSLRLDPALWRPDAVEALGQLSFIKAGLNFADAITTVSPHYAREILTPEFGEGLQTLLHSRQDALTGILNGIDDEVWDPARDPLIARRYDAVSLLEGKAANKRALQQRFGLPNDPRPVLGFVGRLAHQKGADALLAAANELSALPLQIVVVGSGDRELERGFADWARRAPQQVGVRLGYDEIAAHLVEAGADMFLMPSRFEPCGLNQMYSQRYGTVPLVRRVGGLVDTVTDASAEGGTGIVFEHSDAAGVAYAVRRALDLMADRAAWRRLQSAGMEKDFSWARPASQYRGLYERLMAHG